MEGWVKVYRNIMNWEWFDDDRTFKFFVCLLIMANHEDGKWHGLTVERGQLVTSLDKLASLMKCSIQQVRTMINRLKSTYEITSKSTNKFTIITICNYDRYQSDGTTEQQTKQQTSQQTDNKQITNEQQTNNKQITTNKNDNNDNNDNNDKNEKNVIVRFTPPTIEQVAEYCRQRKNNINAERFCAYYESIGWMVGKHKMKDWKQAVITWEQNTKKKNAQNNQSQHLFDGPGTFNVGGVEVELGEKEYIDEDGQRRYWYECEGKYYDSKAKGWPAVPWTAARRPLPRMIWSAESKHWDSLM